ncbi:MAG: VOC family protein [Alphaproteobacteria bacterium]|nr:VOC family protein [Alphaproteobacteria bacterium]
MAFQVLRLDHVVLRVADRDRALAFYRDMLGCRIERDRPDIGLIQLRAGESQIDLVFGKGSPGLPDAANMDHFCVRIDPFDESAIRARLARHGIASGPVAQRFGADGTGPSMYIHDPDGNVIELKGPPTPPT